MFSSSLSTVRGAVEASVAGITAGIPSVYLLRFGLSIIRISLSAHRKPAFYYDCYSCLDRRGLPDFSVVRAARDIEDRRRRLAFSWQWIACHQRAAERRGGPGCRSG